MQKLTKEQAAYIGLYTGHTFGPVEDVFILAREIAGSEVTLDEFTDKLFLEGIRNKIRPTILQMVHNRKDTQLPKTNTKSNGVDLELVAKHRITIHFSNHYAVAYPSSVHSKQFSARIVDGDSYTALCKVIEQVTTYLDSSVVLPPN